MSNNNIPIVKGFIVRGSITKFRFYCPFCDTFHTHCWEYGRTKQYRTAHCGNTKGESPFSETGYYIKLFTSAQTKRLSTCVKGNTNHYRKGGTNVKSCSEIC